MATTLIAVALLSGKYLASSRLKHKPKPSDDEEGASSSPHHSIASTKLTQLLKCAIPTSASTIGDWLSKNVLLMLVAFFFCQLSRQFSSVLLQFGTLKFSWNYAQVCSLRIVRTPGLLTLSTL